MFSSRELISFVFANENDTYYGDDLIKRDLNQYLWEQLHCNYDAVYFLSAEGSGFCVRSYGDLACQDVPKKRRFDFVQNGFGGWLQRQLRAKPGKTAAFVCSLEDFCAVLSGSRWDAVLENIAGDKERTGIFVLTASATAERTTRQLLESPVFEKLGETAVTDLRGGEVRELYSALKKRKGDNCVFLNAFSWERVRALLLHLVMESPDRWESCGQLDALTDYLYTLLRDQTFADSEPLLDQELPVRYLMYATLYSKLTSNRTWKVLEARSADFAKRGGSCKYAEHTGSTVPVLRDWNGYAGRCMKTKLPQWIKCEELAAEKAKEAQEMLRGIQREVSAPKNRLENVEIAAAAGGFLNRLDAAYEGDADSYNQILSGLRFCIDHIYAESEEAARALEIIQKQCDAIGVFQQSFSLRRNQKLNQSVLTQGKLQSVVLCQLEKQLSALEQLKKTYLDLIRAMELKMTMQGSTEEVENKQKTLDKDLGHYEELVRQSGTVKKPDAEEQDPEEPKKEKQEDDFILRLDDYSYTPPAL